MRIAFVGGFAFSPKGTIQARAYPLATELVSRGHEITIFLTPYDNPGDSGRVWAASGVRISNLRTGSTPLSYPGLLARLWRALENYRPELIHIFKPKGFSGAVGSYHVLKGNRALVVDCDDWEGWGGWNDVKPYPWVLKEFIDRQERWLMRRASVLTVASRALGLRVVDVRGNSDGVYYVPNGISRRASPSMDDEIRRQSPGEIRRKFDLPAGPIILYSGHFETAEDAIFFCKAAVGVAEKNGATLLFVGEGPDKTKVREFLAQRQSARVRFLPHLEHTKFLQIIHASDIAAFPYPNDQLHRSKCSARVIDYMRMGKAVITSAVGQNLEYLQNYTSGLLIRPNDEKAFSEGLDLLLHSPELRTKLGNAARKRVEQAFSWSGEPLEQCLAAYRQAKRYAS